MTPTSIKRQTEARKIATAAYRLTIQAVSATLILSSIIFINDSATAEVSILNDGSDKGIATILLHSEIKKGDSMAFGHAADKLKSVTRFTQYNVPVIHVQLDSPGGDVMEAIGIGRLVRDRFMHTRVETTKQCVSACVLVHIAGVSRWVAETARIGLHRPKFDSIYFAGLTPQNARKKYHALVDDLRKYFFSMGASDETFRIMLSTPSDVVRYLTIAELERLGFRGDDPAWEEIGDAWWVERYGEPRSRVIKPCFQKSGDLVGCERKAYERYPLH
jgi:hypothetical protein